MSTPTIDDCLAADLVGGTGHERRTYAAVRLGTLDRQIRRLTPAAQGVVDGRLPAEQAIECLGYIRDTLDRLERELTAVGRAWDRARSDGQTTRGDDPG